MSSHAQATDRPAGNTTGGVEAWAAARARVTWQHHGDSWRAEARCRGTDTEAFYPDESVPPGTAKRACAGCIVRAECLSYALARNEPAGVWGGRSKYERDALRKFLAAEANTEQDNQRGAA